MLSVGRSRWPVAALFGVVAISLAGCGGGGGGPPAAGSGGSNGTLIIGEVGAPTSFAASAGGSVFLFNQAVYDTLLQYSDTGAFVPALATSWNYNPAKTVLTLTTRTGVTFTDGSPFDAQVAAENLTMFKNGTSPFASDLKEMLSATAAGRDQLVVTLAQPDPALLLYMTQQAGYMESAQAFTNKNRATQPVGSGPYILDTSATVVGSSYVFMKNPNYWDKPEQHYAKVVIKIFSDATSMLDAIRAGQIDASDTQLLGNQVDEVKSVPGWSLIPMTDFNWAGTLLFDRDGAINKPLGNVMVRQAMNYAVDRQYLLQILGAGHGQVTSSIFPPGSQGYDAKLSSYYTYDPAKARRLLAQAGYGKGLTVMLMNIPQLQQANNLLMQEFGAVGIKVKLDNVPLTQVVSAIQRAQIPATQFALNMSSSAWVNVQTSIAPAAAWNPFKTSPPALESLIKRLQTASASQADAVAHDINQYVVQQAWDIPMYYNVVYFATSSTTTATISPGINYPTPNLWDIRPKS